MIHDCADGHGECRKGCRIDIRGSRRVPIFQKHGGGSDVRAEAFELPRMQLQQNHKLFFQRLAGGGESECFLDCRGGIDSVLFQ